MNISERKKRILRAIIDSYIESADPVGSKAVAQQTNLEVSSATIRNEMSELEEMGLLEHPHTSSGRIPSYLGYRFYVDELMERPYLTNTEIDNLNNELDVKIREIDKMIADAGRLIAKITNYTTYAYTPAPDRISIKKYEILPVDTKTALLVVITDSNLVRNKLIYFPFDVEPGDLAVFVHVLNKNCTGRKGADAAQAPLNALISSSPRDACVFSAILSSVNAVLGEFNSQEVYLTGAANILAHPEYRDNAKARRLLEYLSDNRGVTQLTVPEDSEQMKIVIGPENLAEELKDASVVVTCYNLGSGTRGLIGVVGPTRMDYAGVIARLQYFTGRIAQLLSNNSDFYDNNST